MPPKQEVLLIDDGELDDVRAVLEELGVEYAWTRPKDVKGEVESPENLFVTTASRGLSLRHPRGSNLKARRPVRIAVGTGSSRTQRTALKRAGFDFLVHRPVHPSALRLLLVHALYRGTEKRRTSRFPFGYEVTYRTRFMKRRVTLLELSAEGCRLAGDTLPEAGTRVAIQVPAEVAGGKALELKGQVVREDQSEKKAAQSEPASTGVRFERMEEETRERLRAVLVERFWGPAMLPTKSRLGDPPVRSRSDRSSVTRGQRRNPRVSYGEEVVAVWDSINRVIFGRDLSCEGMRIEPHRDLDVGSTLRLAIYASGHDEPFLVRATVIRDDGEAGQALRFDDLDALGRQKLENLIRSLWSIESVASREEGPVVVSEVLSK